MTLKHDDYLCHVNELVDLELVNKCFEMKVNCCHLS